MKIAILGSKDSIMGFRALRLDCFSVYEQSEAEKMIDEIYNNKEYGILFITEDWMEKLKTKIDDLKNAALPAVIAIPGVQGATGAGNKEISRIVEKAVGSDILSN